MALTFFVTVWLIFRLNFHSTVKSITSLLTAEIYLLACHEAIMIL